MTEENITPAAGEAKAPVQEMPKVHKFLVGEKVGMTQVFGPDGSLYGVTVVKVGPCRVAYTRTKEKDGYQAVCLGFGHKKDKSANAAEKGLAKKIGIQPIRHLREFRVNDLSGAEQGQVAGVERFAEGEYVDLQAISKGKGFAGGMKRYNFRGGPASHGASDRERAPGSLGSRRSLGRVLPGQRMAGHMGMDTVTVQKVKIIKIIPQEQLLLVNGGVPGAKGITLCVTSTVKKVPKPPVVVAGKKGKKDAAKPAAKKPAAK